MALKVIGAGLPRTGTLSMKAALEALGYGRCYHMEEVFAAPRRQDAWASFFGGGPVDWDQVFEGYGAAVDAPVCFAWKAIAEHFPDAKVVLNVRDPEPWFDSMNKTIFAPGYMDSILDSAIGPMIHNMLGVMLSIAGGPPPDGPPQPGPPPKQAVLAMREAHNAAVTAGIDPRRLLVYRVSEGWEPLCRFLGVDAPSTPFPRVNEAEGFHERFVPPVLS
jgi:hypothetical protein